MVEGSNQIFPGAKIDRGFASDGGIHLREHGGRNLHQFEAAHVERGQQAGHVTNDAASESNEDRISVCTETAQLLGQLF